MAGILTLINRYVVKGFSEETLPEISLKAGSGIPGDRQYALALSDTQFDSARPAPLPKTKFAVLMRFARLAQLSSTFSHETSTLVLRHKGSVVASGSLATAEGCRAIERAIADFLAEELSGTPRVVAADGHRFTDVSVISPEMMEAISLINLASVRALGEKLGREIDPRRFRGNLIVDGLEAWEEFDWIGKDIRVGGVEFEGVLRTRRCPATEVNPKTAERDIRLPAELQANFGHADMGIYLVAKSDGILRRGDSVVASA